MTDRVRQVVWWATITLIVSACGVAAIASNLSISGIDALWFLPFLLLVGGVSALIVCFGVLDWVFGGTQYRLGPGHCLNCGYDLRATPDRCPECGTERVMEPDESDWSQRPGA